MFTVGLISFTCYWEKFEVIAFKLPIKEFTCFPVLCIDIMNSLSNKIYVKIIGFVQALMIPVFHLVQWKVGYDVIFVFVLVV